MAHCRLARDTREYVEEIRGVFTAAGRELPEESELGQALKWMESYAKRMDPLTDLKGAVARKHAESLESTQDAPAPIDELEG